MSHWPPYGNPATLGIGRPIGDGLSYRPSAQSKIVLTQANAAIGPNTYSAYYTPLEGHNRLLVVVNFQGSDLSQSSLKVNLGILAPLQQVQTPQFGLLESTTPTTQTVAKIYSIPDGNLQLRFDLTLRLVFTTPATITITSWREVAIA